VDDAAQLTAQDLQGLAGAPGLGRAGLALLGHEPAARLAKGEGVFDQGRQVGHGAGQGKVVALAVRGVVGQLFRPGMDGGDPLQPQALDHVLQESYLFARGLEEREVQPGTDQLERDAREAGTAADVDGAGVGAGQGAAHLVGEEAGERVEKVADLDLVVFGDGRQVKLLVPGHQLFVVDLERGQLLVREAKAEGPRPVR